MTTITRKNQLEYLFSDDEIPLDIFGVKIPAEDYQRLRMGESSSLLENVITDDRASVRDAKIILTRERDGKVKVNLSFKKPVLEIPDKILDHQLNELQKQDLSAGKTVGPLSYNSQELYLKVDPELNRIVVSCGRELSVPAEIGGYKLSAAEKNDLANGRQLKNKVLKGEYGFFLAKISITDDKKGLVFSDVKEISPLEANRLLADLNRDERVFEKGSVVDNAAIITRDSQPLEHRETLVKKQQESQHNLDREFTTAYEKKNYKELVNLHARGYVPGENQIESLKASEVLSHEEKVNVASIFDRAETIIRHKSAKIDNVISSGGIVASKDVSPARGGSAAKTASSGVDPVYAKSKNVRLKSKEELAAEKAGDQNKKQILKEGLGTALTP